VLVTGCSSGIGRAVAVRLARAGFTVFATVRREADARSLRRLDEANLVSICPLDLAEPDQILEAVDTLKKELRARGLKGLYALVNNAGGGFVAPIELMDLDKFRLELETRVVGPIALIQALLPKLRKGRGRILWITTPALVAVPYVASIHACEFAMQCVAQNLHLELRPWKIPNILIGCGGIRTAAPERTARELEESLEDWPRKRVKLYLPAFEKLRVRLAKFDQARSDPEDVAEVVLEALCSKHPRRRYRVGHMSGVMALLRYAPQPLIDYVFSRLARSG
jgi:NAD(P)-dependent dehydrogenase (short-subunit alcohol dehydrogenase family)